MRDKLIELIGDAPYGLRTLGQAADELISVESIADHLIANGVTFADVPEINVGKWIPVSEQPWGSEEFANVCIYYMKELADFHGYIRAHKVKAHIIRLLQAEAEGRLAIMPPKEGE